MVQRWKTSERKARVANGFEQERQVISINHISGPQFPAWGVGGGGFGDYGAAEMQSLIASRRIRR